MKPIRPLLLATSLALAACGGGYNAPDTSYEPPATPTPPDNVPPANSGSAICDSITGGGSELDHSIDPGCLQCGITNSQGAADGDLSTFATVQVAADLPTQGISVRAKAQPGIVFPAGNTAGANITTPSVVQGQLQYAVEIRTYLGGQQQEAQYTEGGPTTFGACVLCGGTNNSNEAFQTTKPFDAVEVFISNTTVTGTDFKVHEICSDIRSP